MHNNIEKKKTIMREIRECSCSVKYFSAPSLDLTIIFYRRMHSQSSQSGKQESAQRESINIPCNVEYFIRTIIFYRPMYGQSFRSIIKHK